MAKGCLYALLSVASCAAVLVTCLALYLVAGPVGAVFSVLVALVGLCAFIVAQDTVRRRSLAAEEDRRLAQERDHVRRTVDFVADPALTEEERLTIIDSFVPRLRVSRAPFRDRLVLVPELSPAARALLERARRAVVSVYTSQAMRHRLLDGLANEVLLPRQIWEIAMLLRVQTHLRQEQDRAMRGLVTPELRAVLEPQQEALRRSEASVTARVEQLERYARRVQEADAALRAREALDNNDKYRALLAHTDDDEGMRALETQGAALEETLARSVRVAIEAGQTLSLDRQT
ncbi:hypothetical protein [Nonomuraea rubra]|uniref:Uncharacterized protein n=1 Tax=Nonomuraea rubra TaxID=46180 RepID=A0A7X0NSD5_9ACTN|nr:hypothetical protein [Nonomuraea rubra]MBB6548753.1 hypothetical protein [Nonomuraea rubra]